MHGEQHTGNGLVSSNLLLGGAGKSSSLLTGGCRTSRTCTELDPLRQPLIPSHPKPRIALFFFLPFVLQSKHNMLRKKGHIRRAMEVVKPRAMAGATAARRAAAIAVRCKNILLSKFPGGVGDSEGGVRIRGFERGEKEASFRSRDLPDGLIWEPMME